jgi:signal transduction histidine kinase
MLSQSAKGDSDQSHTTAELDRIYDTARDVTRAMDEIVWAVNPRHDTLDSLATYLGKFAQDFLAVAHIPCRLEVPIQLPAWPLTAEVRHNLFLAFKEAVNNAVKHAQAREVRVVVQLAPDRFTLRVEDEGCGFSNGSEKCSPSERTRFAEGNGLRNMSQRLTEIGGRFEIRSVPGVGTTVIFEMPVGATEKV